ncbi:MAG: RAD55 family ATPase [Anaerolineae bacterium]
MEASAGTANGPMLLETGVPHLDLVLGGGLQQHNAYLIVGPTGAGKSLLSQQIAFHRARLGDRVLLLTGLDEPHQNLLDHLRRYRFVDTELIGPRLETVSMVPFLEQPLPEKMAILRKTVLNLRPQFVTLDGLRSLAAFMGGEQGAYQFLYGLTSWFAVEGITLIVTKETGPDLPNEPEFALMDGVLLLQRQLAGGSERRRLWVWKARAQGVLPGPHALTIDSDGLHVWPRPPSLMEEPAPASAGTTPVGVPGLDDMLGGGLPTGSATLLIGPAGSGKTPLALAFLNQGAAAGEPVLWVGLRGSQARMPLPEQLWARDLEAAAKRGLARYLAVAPYQVDPDLLAWRLQDLATESGCRRLVFANAELLYSATAGPAEARSFLGWLAQWTGQRGITLLVTAEGSTDTERLPVGVQTGLYANVLVAGWGRGEHGPQRTIAIKSLARPAYDKRPHRLEMHSDGLQVLEMEAEGQRSGELAAGRW